jgi:hypothetical protein
MELPNGRYRARAVQGVLGRTSKGTEQVAVEFQLYDAEGVPGASITWFGYFSDATFERTIESLRHCGWVGDDLSDLTGIDSNEVSLVIENEEYQGKLYPKVRWVNAPGGGVALREQLSATEAKSFAQRMRSRILAMSQGKALKGPTSGARRAPAGAPPEPPPHTDDDMPF